MFTAGKQHFQTYLYILNQSRGFARLYFQRLTLKRDNSKMAAIETLTVIRPVLVRTSNSNTTRFSGDL